MKRVTGKNAIANLLGGLSGPLIAIWMTPFYLRQIGLEGLGLVGLMTVISSVLGLFVSGVSKTYQRDLSSAQETRPECMNGLISGGLIFYCLIGLVLGALFLLLTFGQATSLSQKTGFSADVLERSLGAISFVMALGIINSGILNSLTALKDLVWPTTLSAFASLATAGCTWIALNQWARVDIFYACQLGGALLTFILFGSRLRFVALQTFRHVLQKRISEVWRGRLKENGKLAGMLMLNEGSGIIIGQMDRILVSSLFPIASLGAYNLAASPSRMTYIVTTPIHVVTYPEFCKFAGKDAQAIDIGEYISRVFFVLCLISAAALIILVTSGRDLLHLWLGTGQIPEGTEACLVILTAGNLLLAIAGLFYNLTVAFGKIGYALYKNLASILILPPVGYVASRHWGLPGIASIWVLYGLLCLIVCASAAYRNHCSFESGRRWCVAALKTLLLAAAMVTALSFVHLDGLHRIIASTACSISLIFLLMLKYFGRDPRIWLHALESSPNRRDISSPTFPR